LLQQGKLAATDSLVDTILQKFQGAYGVKLVAAMAMYQRGRTDSLTRLFEAELTSRDAATQGFANDGLAALGQAQGRLASAMRLRFARRSIDSARGIPLNPLQPALDSSFIDVWYLERPAAAVARLDKALAAHPLRSLPLNRRPYFRLANAYAFAGKPDKARALLAQYDSDQRDTTRRRIQTNERKDAESGVLLAEGKHQEAIAAFRASRMLPDGPADECDACEDGNLGHLFDKAGMPDSAIVHYEQFMASRFPYRWFVDAGFLGRVRKRLGELYEQKGDRAKAAKYYRDFVEQWKNADAELQPQVAEIRRRLSRLADIERK
jgi:tetratricopeptide (TPR) repeat protein